MAFRNPKIVDSQTKRINILCFMTQVKSNYLENVFDVFTKDLLVVFEKIVLDPWLYWEFSKFCPVRVCLHEPTVQ